MARNSRLSVDPSTMLPSINTFGGLNQFLRGAQADEETRKVSESMGEMATQIEAIVASLRTNRLRVTVAPMLVDLLTLLRTHRNLVIALDLPWRGLYEYPGYLQALNNLRVLIGQWLQRGGPRSTELLLTAEDFELVAWRTLGEGMLLIDMYEQATASQSPQEEHSTHAALQEPQVERALNWWSRLRSK